MDSGRKSNATYRVSKSRFKSCRDVNLRKSIDRLWNLFSSAGFLYQVIAISIIYFNYEVNNNISIQSSTGSPLATFIRYPDYTVCFDTESLIESKLIKSASIDPSHGPLVNLTVEQIFKSTPETNDLLETCISRFGPDDTSLNGPSSIRARMYSKSDCYRLYDVTKSIFEEHTCYTISPKGDDKLQSPLRSIVYSGKWSRLLYLFYLNGKQFDRINTIKPMIHPRKTLPYKTYAYSSWFARKWYDESNDKDDTFKSILYNSFKSSNMLYKIRRLPPPYESRCFNYSEVSFTGQEDCIQKCLLRELTDKLECVPFTSYIDKPIRMKQMSMSRLEDANVSAIFEKSDDLCFARCSRPSCFSQISITDGTSELHTTLRLIVFSPSSPDIIVTEEVAFRLLDYLIYLFSCFGSWWGLCWFTLNPIKLYDDIKELHPRMHVRCLTAKVEQCKSVNSNALKCNENTRNTPTPFTSYSRASVLSPGKRISRFNYRNNFIIGSSEPCRLKSYASNEIDRVYNLLNNEIIKLKFDLRNVKMSLKEVKDALLPQMTHAATVLDSPDPRDMWNIPERSDEV